MYSKALVEEAPKPFSLELYCLAATIEHETSFKNMQQARAVLDTILHRSRVRKLTACQVVLERNQFTGMSEKKIQKVDRKLLTSLQETSKMKPVCGDCMYFHDTNVQPVWARQMRMVVQIDSMKFYRRK